MIPWSKKGKRRAVAAAGVVGVVVAAIWGVVGSYVNVVPIPEGLIRIDLLASRDLDTSTPCDLPAGGAGDNKPPVTDQSWTRTGGTSCYPISATAAKCFDATEIPYTVDATGLGWVVEPDSTNRIVYSTAVSCTNWTCRGTATATAGQASPDGGSTASLLSIGVTGNDVTQTTATAYGASAPVNVRVWAKCSSGTVTLYNVSGSPGEWTIACATIGGAWALLTSSHAAVTVVAPWAATAGGTVLPRYKAASGTVSMYVWATTIVEESGAGLSVIPTGAAAVSTGDAAWAIDNTSGLYYKAGDTVTQTMSQISGTCWVVSGTDLLLTGAAGSECSGVWYGLQVTR